MLRAVASGSLFRRDREIETQSKENGNGRRRGRSWANGEMEGKLQGLLNLKSG